ncbi:hypothetical protein M9Y10_005297 [Tritrichomonas musculus]|uniref:Dolichyl-phosphate-mannose--protein mannosyltransferase n=1 Tax=Tritrichomonas musculus TaxID=1915356 RepID=A0ABR2JKS9_9EUKA
MFKKEPELPLAFTKHEKKPRKKLSQYLFPPHKIYPIGINLTDTIIILFLLFIGILTRIYRIQFPMEIIFNEDRIGQEINYYQSGLFFSDYQNSPFTSIFYYFISTLMNYEGNVNYTISTKFCNDPQNQDDCIHIQFRTISAIFSGFCPLLIYLTVRIMFFLSSSSSSTLFTMRLSAFTASILVAFETSLICQGRFMFIDGLLHHCVCCSLFFIYLDSFYLMWHTFLGKCLYLSLSFAISPGQSFGLLFATIIREFLVFNPPIIFRMNHALVRSLFVLVFVLVFQYVVFLIHLKILPFENENSKIQNFLNVTLTDKNQPNWNLKYEKSTFLRLFIQSSYLLFHRNEIDINLKYESRPIKWPFGNFLKGILYVDNYNRKLNYKAALHHYYACIPNIFIYLIVFIFILFGILLIFKFRMKCQKNFKIIIDFLFLFIGYLASFAPFLFVKHTFLYNYLVSLIFGILLVSNVIEKLINPKFRAFIYFSIIFSIMVGYFMFAPYVYGLGKPYCNYFFQ